MGAMTEQGGGPKTGAFEPLRTPVFRRIWSASVLSNFGQLILGVGAAWEMTRLTDSPEMVALVQSAMMVPLMLVALPAGAFADMFDRRKIALAGLSFAAVSAATLAALAFFGFTTPWLLLAFCVLIGGGVAIYGPAWQASIGELVTKDVLPAAVSLGSISYNLARSFGPAVGGIIVVAFGAQAAFGVTALAYLPLILAFFIWRRVVVPSRLPPEKFGRALVSGFRYARNASGVRNAIIRAAAFGLMAAPGTAMAPLIAKDLLGGDAATFGLLLGASGVGAVVGALIQSDVRAKIGPEWAIRWSIILGGLSLMGMGYSTNIWLTAILFFLFGGTNMLGIALLNVGVQLSSPRWVVARALSLYQSALTGGIAVGAWIWGEVTGVIGLQEVLLISGLMLAGTFTLGFVLPLLRGSDSEVEPYDIDHEPDVKLALTMRSGPVVIELDYRVDPDKAREFYDIAIGLQRVRQRNGGFGWSLSRDIADPWLWTERYECPTWGDYLRMRSRYTQADMELQDQINPFNEIKGELRIRRRLERPFGSVRWRADSPDPRQDEVGYIAF